MSANRMLLIAIAWSLAIAGSAQAIVVCRTPDGATYATDRPPPDCAPIPSSEIEKFPPYSASEEDSAAATPQWLRDKPPPEAEPMPPPAAREEPGRREDEGPESSRTHALASCEQSVAEQLERPSSAHWPSRGDYRVKESAGRYSVEGQVEAEQALGSSQIKWRCDAVFSGDRWIAVAELQKEAPPAPPPVVGESAPASPGRSSERERDAVRETMAMPPPGGAPPAPPPSAMAPAAPLPAEALPSTPPAALNMPQEATAAPAMERWKERSSCPGIKFDASTVKYKNEGYQVVSGQITYSGTRPVRDVRVCASGVCQAVSSAGAPMSQGASEKFSVKTPTLDTPVVTAQCSVMVDGPGL